MAFKTMIDQLIKDGLIDKDHKLTQKGHEWVEAFKKQYAAETAKNAEWEIIRENESRGHANRGEKADAG